LCSALAPCLPRPPWAPLFPYTTLFRSAGVGAVVARRDRGRGMRIAQRVGADARGLPGRERALDGVLEGGRRGDADEQGGHADVQDRKSTRLNSSHQIISYAVFCLKKKS